MKWNITVPNLTGGHKDHLNEYPTNNVAERARDYSRTFPAVRVTVSAIARNRMVFVNGIVVQEYPDVSHFYTNIGTEASNEWRDLK